MGLKPGAAVRFTMGNLGLMVDQASFKFEDEIVNEGDEGVYIGPHPNGNLGAEWALVEVETGDRVLLCPCHTSSFEVVSPDSLPASSRKGLLNASKPDNSENSFGL